MTVQLSRFTLTLNRATNYCGKFENNGAMLEVSRDLEVVPKVIKAKPLSVCAPSWRRIPQDTPPTPPRSPTGQRC